MEKDLSRKANKVVVFDSGIGGLNLLRACSSRVPDAEYIYLADNFNVPYGNKTDEEIFNLTMNAFDKINLSEVCAAVIACNTVTARCISRLRSAFPFPVVGIQPAVKQAASVGGCSLVLATNSTVNSAAFRKLCSSCLGGHALVYPCPTLAEYVEENIFSLPEKLPKGLIPEVAADSVVLGCTHYVFIKRQIEKAYNCPVFDGISGTADHFAKILGMTDHFGDFSGNFDHSAVDKPKITFIGGDFNKNKRVFEFLDKNRIV